MKFSIPKLIIGIIVALAGIGIMVNNVSFVTIDDNPELAATLTKGSAIAFIVIGVILVITAFISKRNK